jgi:hypothetical protein
VTNIDRNKPQSLKFKASSVLAGQRVKRTEPPRAKTHISQNIFPDYSNFTKNIWNIKNNVEKLNNNG